MATWLVHLRVADGVLASVNGLEELEYVMGNIAPDSGVPSADWSTYVPCKEVSHFKMETQDGKKQICPEVFAEKFLSERQCREYTYRQLSFYLGYYNHLLTDVFWHKDILDPLITLNPKAYAEDKGNTIWKWKADWYDLDFLYLSKYPHLHAYELYRNAKGFQNTYLDFFSEDAFDNRREYISGFYSENKTGLDREYPYLSEQRMNEFVEETVKRILKINQRFL